MEAYNGLYQILLALEWVEGACELVPWALRGGRLQVRGRAERDRRVFQPVCENQPSGENALDPLALLGRSFDWQGSWGSTLAAHWPTLIIFRLQGEILTQIERCTDHSVPTNNAMRPLDERARRVRSSPYQTGVSPQH